MKITICGSIAFYDEMLKVKEQLEKLGHKVKLPPDKIEDNNGQLIPVTEYYKIRKGGNEDDNSWVWERKKWAMKTHFDKVFWSDAVLALNYDKNGIENYLGVNSLIDVCLALHHDKPIFLLNPVPEVSYKEEILGLQPIILHGDLSKI